MCVPSQLCHSFFSHIPPLAPNNGVTTILNCTYHSIFFTGIITMCNILFFGEVFVIGCVRSPDRQRDSKKSPPRGDGHAAIPSPPFSSWDLGYARTRTRSEFKPLGPGLEPWLTTWESSNIVIMPTACLQHTLFIYKNYLIFQTTCFYHIYKPFC